MPGPVDVDEYISTLPSEVRDVVASSRAAVHAAVPGAAETISYRMPAFTLDGRPFLSIGAWKQHLGVYPVPAFDDGALQGDVAPYRTTKDTVRFPYRSGVPYELLGRIAAAIVRQRHQQDAAG